MKSLAIIGVPIDCSGRFVGVERMSAALRAAGLVERLGLPDRGDLPVAIGDSHRDPETGMIGFQEVCLVSTEISQAIGEMLAQGTRPLVIGGCCTLLIGVFGALKVHFGRVGLAFVDGHLDFYDGQSSPTGEAADMELAILSGLGPAGLVDLAGSPPLVAPRDVVVLGYRDGAEAAKDGAPDPRTAAPEMQLYEVEEVRAEGPATLGGAVAGRLAEAPGRFWLHLDLDVLDQAVMPAVDYLMPGGLDWAELKTLVEPLAGSPALVGVDVTILNPNLDPSGVYTRQVVEFLGELFG
jgi:arginase